MKRAVFLDRDGVLNESPGIGKYVRTPEGLVVSPGAISAVNTFKDLGFLVVVVTNQSCVGRGLIKWSHLEEIHNKLQEIIPNIDTIMVCEHSPNANCSCRKPKTKLVLDAANRLQIDLENSYFVGDELKDVMTAVNAGCIPIKVGEAPFYTLYEFATWLEEKEGKR